MSQNHVLPPKIFPRWTSPFQDLFRVPFLVDLSHLELKRTIFGQKISIFHSENWPVILIKKSQRATPCKKQHKKIQKQSFSAVCGPIWLKLEYVLLRPFLSGFSRSNCQNRKFLSFPKCSLHFWFMDDFNLA